jgi:hypothetical protein
VRRRCETAVANWPQRASCWPKISPSAAATKSASRS